MLLAPTWVKDRYRSIIICSTFLSAARPVLGSVMLDLRKSGISYAVSSDTRVLARYPLAADAGRDEVLLLPAAAARLLCNACAFAAPGNKEADDQTDAKVLFATNDTRTKVTAGTFSMTCHDPTGKFPDYGKIFPAADGNALIIQRKSLIDSIGRCASVIHGSAALVVSLSGNTIRMSMHDDFAKASIGEDLQFCDYTGVDLDVAFNAKKLLETLSLFKCEELRIDLYAAAKPVLIRATDDDQEPLQVIIVTTQAPKNV